MEFKGTKGNFKKDIGFDQISDNLYQCIVYSPEVNTHSVAHAFGITIEETEANAKLIAAAPELLEASKLALEAIELYEKDGYIMKDTIAKNRLVSSIEKALK